MSAKLCRIAGRVQGVGFRAWAEGEAQKRGLSGWVRNRRSGEVEAVFAGADPVVDEMITALWTGPVGAMIEAVGVDDFEGEVAGGFKVRATA